MANITYRKKILFRIVCSVLTCVALFFSAMLLGKAGTIDLTIDVNKAGVYFGISSLSLFVYEILAFIYLNRKAQKAYGLYVVNMCLYLASTVLAFCTSVTSYCFLSASVVYLVTPLIKRAISIVNKHTKRNVVLNVIIGILNAIFLILSVACFDINELRELTSSLLVGIVMLTNCLVYVGSMAFSDFNMELLKKIIRKTYAGEILFGLLLLIIAFSLTLTTVEDGIASFGNALWYCFAIVTTIGFGDFAATTFLGRILSVILGVYGIVVVAIITSIIVNFYNEVKTVPDEEDQDLATDPTLGSDSSPEISDSQAESTENSQAESTEDSPR